MGARLNNSSTGTFTSMDPVCGGSTTAYAYPQDPVNGYDLDGECWGCNTLKSASVVCGVAAAGVGGAVVYSASQTDRGKTPSIKKGVIVGLGGIVGGGLRTGPPKPGTNRAPGPTRWLG